MTRSTAKPSGVGIVLRAEREEASLWRRLRQSRDGAVPDDTARAALRERLFARYRNFARALARRHARRRNLASDVSQDLEQFAYRGLLEAIDRYDPQRRVSFVAFATKRIAGSMVDGLGQLHEHGAHQRFRRRVERERMASLAEERTPAGALEQLGDLVTELALGLMLDQQAREREGDMAGNEGNGFDNLAWRETQALLGKRVDELPAAERSIVRYHYQNDLLFAQIATMLGLSRGRVSQLHKSALAKLRKSMGSLR